LIECRWFRQLKKFLENQAKDPKDNPGPIDNSSLFKSGSYELEAHKLVRMDFDLVPEEVWDLLIQQFGIASGQSSIPRKVRI
jgi:hypothetical protein